MPVIHPAAASSAIRPLNIQKWRFTKKPNPASMNSGSKNLSKNLAAAQPCLFLIPLSHKSSRKE